MQSKKLPSRLPTANTSRGEAVLHARSALHCGEAATSFKKSGNSALSRVIPNEPHLEWE